jgi:glycosyltransferase involved in cell wall biosynthesis
MISKPIFAIDARLIATKSTGDATYWRGLVDGLQLIETNATFLLFSNEPRPKFVPESERFRWIHLAGRSTRWWSLVQFPLAARKAGAKVMHTQYALSPLAGKLGISTIHDVSFFVEPLWFQPRDRFLLQRSCQLTSKIAKTIITVSHSSAREIEHFLPSSKNKIAVTYPACGIEISKLSKAEAAQILTDELKIGQPFMLAVGTRWPRKNMQLAIDATALLGPGTPKLVISGKAGWGEERLNPHVVATGYVTDRQLSALYSAAELYLAPSFHEGFGITLLEAFTCGCPVLCSRGGAHPEVAGLAADIMPDFEPTSWAERIRRLLPDSSKLEEMRELGIHRASDFSWKRMAQETYQVYFEAMK